MIIIILILSKSWVPQKKIQHYYLRWIWEFRTALLHRLYLHYFWNVWQISLSKEIIRPLTSTRFLWILVEKLAHSITDSPLYLRVIIRCFYVYFSFILNCTHCSVYLLKSSSLVAVWRRFSCFQVCIYITLTSALWLALIETTLVAVFLKNVYMCK